MSKVVKKAEEGFKIIEHPKVRGESYAEEGQEKLVYFAYASLEKPDTVKQLHKYIVCRDFLGDALWAEENNETASIYSFTWNPKERKIDRDRCRLLVKTSAEEVEIILKNLPILQKIEEQNGWDKSRVVKHDKEHLLFEGDPNWQASIVLISLYTFLIKCIAFEFKDQDDWFEEMAHVEVEREKRYSRTGGNKALTKILKNLNEFADPKVPVAGKKYDSFSHDVHHHTGFVSMLKGLQGTEYVARAKKIMGK